jgi:hypothetical protein
MFRAFPAHHQEILYCLVSRSLWQTVIQWNLDPLFLKGVEKTNAEYGETINLENHFLNKKIVHCLLLLGRILPQLKI